MNVILPMFLYCREEKRNAELQRLLSEYDDVAASKRVLKNTVAFAAVPEDTADCSANDTLQHVGVDPKQQDRDMRNLFVEVGSHPSLFYTAS